MESTGKAQDQLSGAVSGAFPSRRITFGSFFVVLAGWSTSVELTLDRELLSLEE